MHFPASSTVELTSPSSTISLLVCKNSRVTLFYNCFDRFMFDFHAVGPSNTLTTDVKGVIGGATLPWYADTISHIEAIFSIN